MSDNIRKVTIEAYVYDSRRGSDGRPRPIVNAIVELSVLPKKVQGEAGARASVIHKVETDDDGCARFHVSPDEKCQYQCEACAFGLRGCSSPITISPQCAVERTEIKFPLDLTVEMHDPTKGGACNDFAAGGAAVLVARWSCKGIEDKAALARSLRVEVDAKRGSVGSIPPVHVDDDHCEVRVPMSLASGFGTFEPEVRLIEREGTRAFISAGTSVTVNDSRHMVGGDLNIRLHRTANETTHDIALWAVIRKSCEAMSFNNYMRFTDHVLCGRAFDDAGDEGCWPELWKARTNEVTALSQRRFLPFTDSDAYRLLKIATEAFVTVNSGVCARIPFNRNDRDYLLRRDLSDTDLNGLWHNYLVRVNGTHDRIIPYLAIIREKLRDVPIRASSLGQFQMPDDTYGILQAKLAAPCFNELIWSYWHEEAMVVQTINALCRRFQNVRRPGDIDPLATLDIDPLRSLNNLLWGLIQDEQHRLSVVRRNYEYDHHYGLRLEGRATRNLRPADSRSKFLEAFHNLLALCWKFFKQDDDTTYKADGFTVLNGLKEVHLLLSHGAHNQFGDLPTVSRTEMLMNLWLLARPEFREFLPGRTMTANPEIWIDRVDAMKKLQNWTDVSALHFRNLAVYGEQILASVRYGNWTDISDPSHAANWARFWRPQLQSYIHDYRVVTGADLASESEVDTTLPAVHLSRRLAEQVRAARA